MRNKVAVIVAALAAATFAHATPKATSLYEKIGIHKIAQAASNCIDMEAADEMLNKNETFHKMSGLAPKPFAKFTLTAYLANLAGGPQKVVADIASLDKAFGLSKDERKHVWEVREAAFVKAGISKDDFRAMRRIYSRKYAETQAMTSMEPEKFQAPGSLYARLGGLVPISLVVDDFVNLLATDPTVTSNPQVVKSLTSGKVTGAGLKYLVTEQLAAASGGPCAYSGRTMADSHKGLMITEDQWKQTAGLLKQVLDKYNVPDKEQSEIFAVVSSTHDDIVGK